MSKWTRVLGAPRAVINIISDEFIDNLPNIFIALGLALAGIVVAWIAVKFAACCTRARSSKRWKRSYNDNGLMEWKTETNWSGNSRIRFFWLCFAILSVVTGFWVAAHTAGFNFWTLIFQFGIFGVVITYSFGGALRDGGAFFLLSFTNKIEEDWWIEVVGLGVSGRITAIHILWVEVEYLNPKTNSMEEAHIPTAFIMANVIKRKFEEEKKYIALNTTIDPNTNKAVVKHPAKRGLRNIV